MTSPLKFDQLRPRLKACEVYVGDRNVVVEGEGGQSQIVLPKENEKILKLLDGQHTVQEISAELYADHGQVSFHAILTTIKLLHEAQLLEGVEGQFDGLLDEKSPHEQKVSLLSRPIFEVKLAKRIHSKPFGNWVFYGFVGALLTLLGFNVAAYLNLELASFLKSSVGYDQALLKIFVMSSLLMTFKSVIQAMLLLSSTGTFYGPFLRLHPYGVALAINDNSIYSHPSRYVIIGYGIISACLYAIIGAGLCLIPGFEAYRNDCAILAILLSFIELNPYRRSDLTKLFHFFYAEKQLKSIMPYLKNCSLTGILKDSGAKLSDEVRYVTYSVLSIGWAVGFAVFSLEIVLKSFPSLFYQIQMGAPSSKYSAMAVASLLLFITGYLLSDLFHTVAKNILSPIFVPLMRLRQSSRKYKRSDLSLDDVRINLKKSMLFNQFSEEALDFLMANSTLRTMRADGNLILQGDKGREVFFLVKGSVHVVVRESTGRSKHVVTLNANAVIGEMAILEEVTRTANVVAAEEIVYLEFHEKAFAEILTQSQFQTDSNRLKNRIEISRFVSSANMFKDFPPEVMNLFVEAGDLALFPAGHNVVDEGELDKTFFLLIRGKVTVTRRGQIVNQLGQGDFFGEIALIANVPRTATVTTTEECLFLYIDDKKFWKILSENIELAMYVEGVSRHRMADPEAEAA